MLNCGAVIIARCSTMFLQRAFPEAGHSECRMAHSKLKLQFSWVTFVTLVEDLQLSTVNWHRHRAGADNVCPKPSVPKRRRVGPPQKQYRTSKAIQGKQLTGSVGDGWKE